jgi:hypothetical protein
MLTLGARCTLRYPAPIPHKEPVMLKKLILFAVVGGLVYLNYTNPPRADHEALLLAELQELGPVSEEQFTQAMREVDFSNFMVCSATKTSEDSKLITFGYLKKTKVMNDKWLKDTAQKLQARQGY